MSDDEEACDRVLNEWAKKYDLPAAHIEYLRVRLTLCPRCFSALPGLHLSFIACENLIFIFSIPFQYLLITPTKSDVEDAIDAPPTIQKKLLQQIEEELQTTVVIACLNYPSYLVEQRANNTNHNLAAIYQLKTRITPKGTSTNISLLYNPGVCAC